jgi:peptidoglycan/LPS O-acetylase OafA/YrhL
MIPNPTPTPTPALPSPPQRLTELDWVRIGAFGLLILYHVGMFYVSWDWHVKSPAPVPALEAWMQLLSPWRLSLLFVVSGAATGLMLRRGSAAAGLGERSRRLLPPLLLGMALIVPPQPYLEVVEKLGYAGSYLDFLGRYYRADHGFCREGKCLDLPTWNHLWFVAYLWVYSMALLALCRFGGSAWLAHPRWQALTRGARLLWLPALAFGLVRQQLLLPFPSTHNLTWDWFNHALFGTMFVLGTALFGQADDRHGAWAAAQRWRGWALAGAALLLVGMPQTLAALGGWEALTPAQRQGWLLLGGARHWLPIVAVLGFARQHLRGRDGPARRWLTDAVFPFYIVHQTVIVIAAHLLAQRLWPQPLEAATLVVITAAACVLSYLLVRRVGWLRPGFGLPPRRAG